jgi:1,2-diacylglycerol 3-beta-galactosyltransferase
MWKEHTPAPFNRLCDSYSFLVRYGFLWRLTYGMLQPSFVHKPYFAAIGAVVSARLMAAFDAYSPDLVVSVHPLMQHIPIAVLRARAAASGAPAPPFATVVTDFTTCHNTWFHPEASRCFVPTEFCAALARQNGVPPDRIVVHGLPIRPVFSQRLPAKRALRAKLVRLLMGCLFVCVCGMCLDVARNSPPLTTNNLILPPPPTKTPPRKPKLPQGLKRDPPAILVVGGGEGMGALEATVRELDARLQGGAQVAVICGRNRRLLHALRSAAWPGGTHVAAVGFVDNMHEWMAACDVIITKAGPGTIAEALISGLPILLNGNVPCQEEGNIPYVVDNGVGAFETDPARIAGVLAGWLAKGNAAEFAAMAKRSKALGRPRAVFDIARDLKALVDEAAAAGAAALRRRS